jgi:hypothetical protein
MPATDGATLRVTAGARRPVSAAARRPVTTVTLTAESALALAVTRNRTGTGTESERGVGGLLEWLDRVDAVVIAPPRPSELSGAGRGADPSLVVAALIARHPRAGWIIGADLAREHPYNLARRIASLAALAPQGVGVLLESTGSALPGLGSAAPDDVAADGALVLQKLWQSWPADSVVADRAARRFVDVSRIRRVDHDGVFRVAGPLQLPVAAGRQPVVLQRAGWSPGGADGTAAAADVLVTRTPAGGSGGSDAASGLGPPPRPRLLEIAAADLLRHDGGTDVLVTGPAADIVAVLRARSAAGLLPVEGAESLRDRLHARLPVERLLSAAVAFPAEKW